jgi:probable F420-dependent oxidoreductase
MKFGLSFASSIAPGPVAALELCKRAEGMGFDSVWAAEHVVLPAKIESRYPYTADGVIPVANDTPIPDPLIWLAYVAAAVPSMKLGTCILILPQRNPLVLAKELATLDHLSGGRVELGIGVGWLKEEFEALGVPWARRGARTNEYMAALRTLWSGPEVAFSGEFIDFPKVTVSPRPAAGSIPIIVGGDSPAAVRRAATLGDGFYPGTSDPKVLEEMIKELHRLAIEAGRDPSDIAVHVNCNINAINSVKDIEHYQKIGVSRVLVPSFIGLDGFKNLQAISRETASEN